MTIIDSYIVSRRKYVCRVSMKNPHGMKIAANPKVEVRKGMIHTLPIVPILTSLSYHTFPSAFMLSLYAYIRINTSTIPSLYRSDMHISDS